ncbi:hypothetical protein GCM10010505_20960 [Kitasatospora aburaviensis]
MLPACPAAAEHHPDHPRYPRELPGHLPDDRSHRLHGKEVWHGRTRPAAGRSPVGGRAAEPPGRRAPAAGRTVWPGRRLSIAGSDKIIPGFARPLVVGARATSQTVRTASLPVSGRFDPTPPAFGP